MTAVKHPEEVKMLEDYIAAKNLKYSGQREEILDVFLSTKRHLTVNELYRLVQKKYPSVGYATIYRTIRLLCECGLCRELRFSDGTMRYEQLYGHEHHDHLVCTQCGKIVEVVDPQIERLQEKLFQAHAFAPQGHRMELYGRCKSCKG